MAGSDDNKFIKLIFETDIDSKKLTKQLEGVSDNIAGALATSLTKATASFATKLGKSIQFTFDDTVVGTLKKPIKITLDLKGAKDQIRDLVKPLQKVVGMINDVADQATSGGTGTGKKKGGRQQRSTLDDLETIKEYKGKAESIGPSGNALIKTLDTIEKSIVSLGKQGSKGTFTQSQIKAFDALSAKVTDAKGKIDQLANSLQAIRDRADSGEKPVQDLERALGEAQQGLRSFNVSEDQITAASKKAAAGIDFLKEQYNLLFDEVRKGEPDLARVFSTMRKIDNAEALAATRIKTLNQDRDSAKVTARVRTLEEEEAAREKAQKAEIRGNIIASNLRKSFDDQQLKRKRGFRKSLEDDEIKRQKAENERSVKAFRAAQNLREQQAKAAENFAKAEASRNNLKALPGRVSISRGNTGNLIDELDQIRVRIARVNDVPLADVVRKTARFESTLLETSAALKRLDDQLRRGLISEKEADKRFKTLNETLARTKVAIEQISGERLSRQFKQGELDSFAKGATTNFAVLGFTLGHVAGELQQFGQNALQAFSQLATAAQPIEQAQNIIRKNFVDTAKLTQDEADILVEKLKTLADLPGNNLKDTTAQFLRFADAFGDPELAENLNRGIVLLGSNTGVDKSNELTQILLDARTKDKGFNQDSFGKIQSLGGANVVKALQAAGITSTESANNRGVSSVIRILAKELSKLQAPILTTADKFNRLSNRVAELGASIGKILSPALDNLNDILDEKIIPAAELLYQHFLALSPATQSFISNLVIGIPVLAVIGGAIIGLGAALSFAASGFLQLSKFAKLIFNSAGFGKMAKEADLAATALNKVASATTNVANANKNINPALLQRLANRKAGIVTPPGGSVVPENPTSLITQQQELDKKIAALKKQDALYKTQTDRLSPSNFSKTNNAFTGNNPELFEATKKGARVQTRIRAATAEAEGLRATLEGIQTGKIDAATSSFKGFRKTVLEFITDTKIRTGFSSLTDFFVSLPRLILAAVIKPFSLLKGAFTSIVATFKELGAAKAIFAGLSGGVGLLTKGIGGLAGGLFKILGFTNPLGIAINVILSVVTALVNNFNGIRDRVVKVFGDFYNATVRLTKALGLGDGGLWTILKGIGSVLDTVFGFIGEVVLDVLNAVVLTLTDIINNLAAMFEYFRNGQIGLGLLEGLKLVANSILGLFKNLAVEIAATLADAVGGIIDSIFGVGKNKAGQKMQGTNLGDFVRQINGTDKQSVAIQSVKDSQLKKEQKIVDDTKQAQREALENAKETQERIQETIKKLNAAFDKAHNDFIKFRFDQALKSFQAVNELIQENTDLQIEKFKELAEATDDLNVTTSTYSVTVGALNQNLADLISSQNSTSLAKALSEFRTGVTGDDFKSLYDGANLNIKAFQELKDSIDKVSNSTSVDELTSKLAGLKGLTAQLTLETPELGVNFFTGMVNLIEKTRLAISEGAKEANKAAIAYRKQLEDLRKFEIDRRANLEIERLSNEAEAKNRKRDLQSKIEDIKAERTALQFDRDEALTGTRIAEEYSRNARSRTREAEARVADLELEEAKIRVAFQRDKEAGRIPDYVSIENQLDFQKVSKAIQDAKSDAVKLEEEYEKLFGDQKVNSFEGAVKSLIETLRQLGQVSSEISKSVFSAFGNATSKTVVADPLILQSNYDSLVKISKQLPINSSFAREYKEVIKQLAGVNITASEATERLIKALVEARLQTTISETQKARRTYSKNVESFNADFAGAGAGIRNFSSSALYESIYQLIQNGELSGRITGNSTIAGLNPDQTDELRKILFNKEIGSEEISKQVIEFVQKISAGDEKVVNSLLAELFNFEKLGLKSPITINAIETITNGIKYLDAQRKEDAERFETDLQTRIEKLELDVQRTDQNLEDQVLGKSQELNELDRQLTLASGKERELILRTQSKIKLDIISLNYQKLDLEAAYQTQKAILEAKGNQGEIDRIVEQGKKVRDQLQKDRDENIRQQALSSGLTINKSGNPVDEFGNPIPIAGRVQVANVSPDDTSGTITNEGTGADASAGPRVLPVESRLGGLDTELNNIGTAAEQAGDKMLSLFDRIASGEDVIKKFKGLISGMGGGIGELGNAFKEVAKFGIAAFGKSLGQALVETLTNGGNFLKNLGKFFGDTLIMLGSTLIQIGITALAMSALAWAFPVLKPLLDPSSAGAGAAAVAIAVGAGLVLAGKAMGGGAAATASNTNASNGANSAAGNSGQPTYDPEKDPKLIYQRALQAQVLIDIKTDEGQIVKTFIKTYNRDPRLGNVIGNRNTSFAL